MSDLSLIENNYIDYKALEDFLAKIWDFKMKGKQILNKDCKNYFKIRHNLLHSLTCDYLGLDFSREKPFSHYGINSKRTPDIINFDRGKFNIIEFTVSNNLRTILRNKEDFSKYDSEKDQIQQLGYTCDVYFIYISMDGNNDESIDALDLISRDMFVNKDASKFINEVYSKMHYYHILVLRFFPELLNQYDDSSLGDIGDMLSDNLNYQNYERVEEGLPEINLVVSKFLTLHKVKFLKMMKRMRIGLKYIINIHIFKADFHFILDEDGMTKDEISLLYETKSPELSKIIFVLDMDLNDKTNPFSRIGFFPEEDRETTVNFVVDYHLAVNDFLKHESFDDTLVNNDLSVDKDLVKNCYLNQLEELKTRTYSYVIREKNPFTIHCFNPQYSDKPMLLQTGNMILDSMISRIKEVKFKPRKISKDFKPEEIDNINKDLTIISTKLKTINYYNFMKLKKMGNNNLLKSELFDKDLLEDYLKCRKKFNEKMKDESKKQPDRLIHTLPMSVYKEFWSSETEFMNTNKGKVSIYQSKIGNLEHIRAKYVDYFGFIMSKSGIHDDNLMGNTDPLGIGTSKLLEGMRIDLNSTSKAYTDTIYFKTLMAYSKIAYSIMYYSMVKANKNDFFIENCGISNIILIVKGGKKILSNKRSRMFKLIINIEPETVEMYNKGSFLVHQYKGKYFLSCPWRSYSIKMLKHLNELPYKFANYYNCSFLESGLTTEQYHKFITTRVLLSLSNKRKLEVWSSSFRYIYFNSLGTHTSILELIPSMVINDSDEIFWLYQRLFAVYYSDLYNSSQNGKLFDLINLCEFNNYDLCAEKFQEAILMVKADFNSENEYLRNLRSVLEGSRKYKTQISGDDEDTKELCLEKTACEMNEDYKVKIRSNDYTFSPQLMMVLGSYFSEKLSSTITRSELSSKFDSIFRSDFSNMANSRGLRYSNNIFWGAKGFDVVEQYKDENLGSKVKSLKAVNENFKDSESFMKFMRSSDKSFLEFYTPDVKSLRYDMANKDQWGDKREVFSQDMVTKALQNPIEKYFMFLSKFCPNEMIHMKSSTRPKFMHRQVFEETSDNNNIVYATMDCSKWAPESNNWKYYFFIKGMSKFLPENFVSAFNKLWYLMFNKYVVVKKGFIKKLKMNKSNGEIDDLIILNEEMTKEHYEIYKKSFIYKLSKRQKRNKKEEPKIRPIEDFEIYMIKRNFDFVMGMYNSLSSLVHAVSQMFFADYISPRFDVTCKFYAHSDDSAGRLVSRKLSNIYKVFSIYERFQRAINHKLSKKKSKLCNNSLEMISIMYYNKRFIPTTHKFLTQISFDPSGEGWFSDISSVVSKVVDVHVNGGSYIQMYSTMLIQSELMRKSYSLANSRHISKVPLVFGGTFNIHPLHIILLGSSAQEVMLDLLETDEYREIRIQLYKSYTGSYCPTKPIDMAHRYPVFTRHGNMLMENEDNTDMLKAIAALDLNTGLGRSVVYYNKLKDSSFRMSLVGTESDKLYLNMLFYKTKVTTNIGTFKFKNVSNLVLSNYMTGLTERSDSLKRNPRNIYESYIQSVEGVEFNYDFNIESTKSCKPISYDTVTLLDMNLDTESFKKILALSITDKITKYIPNSQKYKYLMKWIMSSLPGSQEDRLEIIKKYQRNDLSRFRSTYMYMPTGLVTESLNKFITYSIFYCTRRYKISESNPNLYSIRNFDKESSIQPHLQHMAVINLILSTNNTEEIKEMCMESVQGCDKCRDLLLDQMESYFDFFDFKIPLFETMLPIATYERAQRRGSTGWYGDCDFSLYYMGCKVIHKNIRGNYNTIWLVFDPSMLQPMYIIYKIFCNTRSIPTERPSYLKTNQVYNMLSFTDISTPAISNLDSYEMALPFSVVESCNLTPVVVSRDSSGKVNVDGDEVDFNIYNLININKNFIIDHNLTKLKDKIHNSKGLYVDTENLITFFSISKISKIILQLDEYYSLDNILQSYYSGLLGSDFSFSKALFVSNKRGITDYKTMNMGKIESRESLENKYLGHLPLLDLVDDVSFFRMSINEKNVVFKVIRSEKLNDDDIGSLVRIRDKLGSKAAMNSITLFKIGREINDVAIYSKLNKSIRFDMMCTLIKVVYETDFNSAGPYSKSILTIKKKRFFQLLFGNILRKDYIFAADLLARGVLFANSVNKKLFWDYIKNEPLLPLLSYEYNKFPFFYGCFELTLINNNPVINKFDDVNFPIYRRFQKKFFYTPYYNKKVFNYEYTVSKIFNVFTEPYTFEDYLLDDVEDDLDDDDKEEREWEGDDVEVFIYTYTDLQVAYNLSHCNINSLKCFSNFRYFCIPWLGYPKMYKTEVHDEDFYVTEYSENQSKITRPLENMDYKYTDMSEKVDILKSKVDNFKEVRCLTDLSPIVKDFKVETRQGINELKDVIADFCNNNGLEVNKEIMDRYINILFPGVKDPGFSINDFLDDLRAGLTSDLVKKMFDISDTLRKNKKSNVDLLPGFTTHTNDHELLSELKSLFPKSYLKILQGQLNLTKNVRRNMEADLDNLILNNTNEDNKMLLIFLKSLLLDSVESGGNDEGFLEFASDIILKGKNKDKIPINDPSMRERILLKQRGSKLSYQMVDSW